MAVNPYEPPQTPPEEPPDEERTLVAWPASGAYVYYQTLVWQPDSPLPPVCVRTGLPANDTITLTLKPLIDDDGSVPPAVGLRPRSYDVRLPVRLAAAPVRTRPHWGMLLILTGTAGALAVGMVGSPLSWVNYGFAAAVAILFIGLGFRLLAKPAPIQLLCVDRGFLQLFGLHANFLAALPEWPVPDRDSEAATSALAVDETA